MSIADLKNIKDDFANSYIGRSDRDLNELLLEEYIEAFDELKAMIDTNNGKIDDLDSKIDALEKRVEALE